MWSAIGIVALALVVGFVVDLKRQDSDPFLGLTFTFVIPVCTALLLMVVRC
jgi:hypothetical protein